MTGRKYDSTITGISISYRLVLPAGGLGRAGAEWSIATLAFVCLFCLFLRRYVSESPSDLHAVVHSLLCPPAKPTVALSHPPASVFRYFRYLMLVPGPTVGTGCSEGDCRPSKLFPIEHSVGSSDTGDTYGSYVIRK